MDGGTGVTVALAGSTETILLGSSLSSDSANTSSPSATTSSKIVMGIMISVSSGVNVYIVVRL